MTSYLNNNKIQMQQDILRPVDWLKGQVIGKAGRFAYTKDFPSKGGVIQLNDIYALAAKIKVSDDGTFPNGVNVKDVSILRSPKWFNGLISYDHRDYQDLEAGRVDFANSYRKKVSAVEYAHDQELEDWFVGYSATWAADPHVDNNWIPWFNAVPAASSSSTNPADMNHLVTTTGGTTGTEGTILDMGTVLYSGSTNATVNFVLKTFQPIISAFDKFKDANTGLRMVDSGARYTFMASQELIGWLKKIHPYDGSQYNQNVTIADQMSAANIDMIINEEFTSSIQEDGTCQFGLVADFEKNFQIGVLKAMSPGPWKDSGGVLPQHEQGFESRYIPYTQPYWDGSAYWRKAFFHGSFTFMNDAA